jgi:hypothetical protein
MNDQGVLNTAHILVKEVMYLDALKSDEQPWLFDGDNNRPTSPPVLEDHIGSDASDQGLSTAWSWVLVAGAVGILLTLVWARRRQRRRRGDFAAGQPPGSLVTKGYMGYPSPETASPERRDPLSSNRLGDNPATSDEEEAVPDPDRGGGGGLAHDGSFPHLCSNSTMGQGIQSIVTDQDAEDHGGLTFYGEDDEDDDDDSFEQWRPRPKDTRSRELV